MRLYKLSKYNFIIEDKLGKVLVYNTFSGSLISLDKSIYLGYKDQCDPNGPYFEELYRCGVIVANELNEYNRVKSQIDIEINNPLSKSANFVIAPTLNCNLNCFYCFEKANHLEQNEFSKNTMDAIVKFILDSITPQTKHININWFGGEPLLKYDSILYIGQKLKKSLPSTILFSSRIITNGVFLTKERCVELTNKCNLQSAQITVDGFADNYCLIKHASLSDYTNVIRNIVDCSNIIRISVCLNALKENIVDLFNITEYLLKDCCLKSRINIFLVRVKNYINGNFSDRCFSEDEFSKVYEDYIYFISQLDNTQKCLEVTLERMRPCGIMRYCDAAIDPEGYLYKCEHNLGQHALAVGDVVNGWYYNEAYVANSRGIVDSRCRECVFYPRCGFALCVALHSLSGEGLHCNYYDIMKKRATKYILERRSMS